jgi:hypothetical protein
MKDEAGLLYCCLDARPEVWRLDGAVVWWPF